MPRNPHDFDIEPGRLPPGEREDEDRGRRRELDDAGLEPERSVSRHADADEADEAELAEEDLLEISELDDELEASEGEGPDA